MDLPTTTLASDSCCGFQTHLRSVRYRTQDITDPPRTAKRWVVIVHWQCHVEQAHSGDWYRLTDDPDDLGTYRDGSVIDPFAAQRIR